MESYSYSFSSSSYSQETERLKVPQSYHSSLHSVRKPQVKPWKKPIAPLPPTPPKVYKVDPMNFRDLVQKLTGAPEPQTPQRLQSLAPPPLDLAGANAALPDRDGNAPQTAPLQLLPSPVKSPFSAFYQELISEINMDAKPNRNTSSLELNLSPTSHNWCSLALLSPGTLSSLEPSTVL